MKIKVAHIITKLEMGGAQDNTIYTVKNLNKEKFETILISGKGGILDEKVISDKEIKIIFVETLKREISPLNDIKAVFEIKKILDKEKPDIIHTHSSKAGIIGRLAGKLSGINKIIHTFHGFGFNNKQNLLLRNFFIFLEKISALITDKLIFVSKENLKTAIKLKIGNDSKYLLIRSGIKISNYKANNRKIPSDIIIPEMAKVIISIGNLKPQKNPDDFYEIAKKTISLNLNVCFLYIGGGDRIEYFRKQIETDNLNNRCKFLGWREDVKDILSIGDIFILTSLWEGLPRSLIEAMLSGLVPICYKTDGILDIIENGKNGLLFEKNEKDKIVESIKNFVNNEELYKKFRTNVLNTDLSEFDIDLMVKKQEDLYMDILTQKFQLENF